MLSWVINYPAYPLLTCLGKSRDFMVLCKRSCIGTIYFFANYFPLGTQKYYYVPGILGFFKVQKGLSHIEFHQVFWNFINIADFRDNL